MANVSSTPLPIVPVHLEDPVASDRVGPRPDVGESVLRIAAAYLAWPVITGTFIFLYVSLAFQDRLFRYRQSSIKLTVLSALCLAVWICLERWMPYRQRWNRFGRQGVNDFLHYAGGIVVSEEFAIAVFYALLPSVVAVAPRLLSLWPSQASLVIQVSAALAMHELGEYAYHRLSHRVPWLWDLHRLHHTSERITLTKGFRHNVVDRLLNECVFACLMILSGIPGEVLVWVSAIYIGTGIPAHANVDLRFPSGLNAIFINPAVHRVHHAVDARGGNSNFGGVLMIWDLVFGTFIDPVRYDLGEVGMENNTLPEGFWGQYWSFLRWNELDVDSVKQAGGC